MYSNKIIILGAGITGLSAGIRTGFPIYEESGIPGGLCYSYYMRPNSKDRFYNKPDDGVYRFEFGGGHWIFGYDNAILDFLNGLSVFDKYYRKASVQIKNSDTLIPYPLQNNLRYLDKKIVDQILSEISKSKLKKPANTMKEWLVKSFGPTLCGLFFYPFHELYTADLYDKIAHQDSYKSPVDISLVIKGALEGTSPAGYNSSFVYPTDGLDKLAQKMAEKCDIKYNMRVDKIDPYKKEIYLNNQQSINYHHLISTIPLNKIVEIAGIDLNVPQDPYTSVLVLNIGAIKGDQCPDDHWIYIPESPFGYHRIGFYSNVDPSFLPLSGNTKKSRVSIYIEKAFPGEAKPDEQDIASYSNSVVKELKKRGIIGDTEVIDYNWIEVAYTWSWADSHWKNIAIKKLKKMGINQIGRYGKWSFQGIADSIRDGLSVQTLLE